MAKTEPPPSGPITIEQALRLPSLRRGSPQILAGRGALGRTIRWVHASEVPHIATLLHGDELLLVTGMGIGTSARAQRHFVRELSRRGIAGLIVELGQVFARLPDPVIDEAEACGLPLVTLRREVPFIDITEEIHREIVDHEIDVLHRAAAAQDRFTELLLAGEGISELLAALATTIGNPVVLEKHGRSALYHATHRTEGSEVLAAWEVIASELDQGTEPAMAVASCAVPGAGGAVWGRLVALALDGPLADGDRLVVQRAAGLVALALLRTRQETLLAARQRGDFLTLLAQERIDPQDVADRAASLGFVLDGGPLLPVAFTTVNGRDEATSDEDWTPIWQRLRQELRAQGHHALIGSIDTPGDALAILRLGRADDREATADTLAELARHAVRRHVGSPDMTVIAVGPAVSEPRGLPGALRRAIDAAAAGREVSPRPWHDAEIPTLDGLLNTLRNNGQLREFARQRLAPLLEHDRRRAAKLLPTLEALSASNWRKTDAARALYLNRQALYARMARIERLLEVDLGDPEQRLGLEVALRVARQLGIDHE